MSSFISYICRLYKSSSKSSEQSLELYKQSPSYERWKYDYSNFYTDDEIKQISDITYKNIKTMSVSSFDEIDNILITADFLLKTDRAKYVKFIYECPYKFMVIYANNSERTPYIINYVKTFDENIANKIYSLTNDTNKKYLE
jgi:hypothetical protein